VSKSTRVGWAEYGTGVEEKKNKYRILAGMLMERYHFESFGIDWRIIVKAWI
jgi:hypothetical protein